MQNYVVTAQKPTTVLHSFVANFTGPTDQNLIIAKPTRIEVHLLTSHGIQPMVELNVYGRIATLKPFPRANGQDCLFLTTEKYKFCVLGFHEGEITTIAGGDILDRIGRPAESGQITSFDPEGRLVGMHLYDGLLKIIPISETGVFCPTFNLRVEELRIIDFTFLAGQKVPTLVILYEDAREARHLKAYHIDLEEKDISLSTWAQPRIERGASHLVPIPLPLGGFLCLGKHLITYHHFEKGTKSLSIDHTNITAHGMVDPTGERHLIGDFWGNLSLLQLHAVAGTATVDSIEMRQLGATSIPSTLTYLDASFVYVGSHYGDSQLIRLLDVPDESGSHVEVVDSFVNLGPILDFTLVDLGRQGQKQVVACSGGFKDGSLRIVRSGIGINELAFAECPGIKGLWPLRAHEADAYDKYLVQSYIADTRVLAIDGEALDEVDETAFPGLDRDHQTFACANVAHDQIVQVTDCALRLISCNTMGFSKEWKPPQDIRITRACIWPTMAAVALVGGNLVCIQIGNGDLIELSHAKLDHEIACLDLGPPKPLPVASSSPASTHPSLSHLPHTRDTPTLLPPPFLPTAARNAHFNRAGPQSARSAHLTDPEEQMAIEQTTSSIMPEARYAVAGMWTDRTIRFYALPELREVHTLQLNEEFIPRSVLFQRLDDIDYLLIGLGDGHLLTYRFDPDKVELTESKKILLALRPMNLSPFFANGAMHVFASCDRPTVLSSNNRKLFYSNVNLKEVNHMCPFHSELYPESLVLATESVLTFGSVDSIQKLHIRKIPLGGEMARRIAYQEPTRSFCILTHRMEPDPMGSTIEQDSIRVLDDECFDTKSAVPLDAFERGASICSAELHTQKGERKEGEEQQEEKDEYYVVGTGYTMPNELESSKGRIIVIRVDSQLQMEIVAEKEVRGCVYSVKMIEGRIVAAINNRISIFELADMGSKQLEIQSRTSSAGHIVALDLQTRGNFILSGDLMRSISVHQFSATEGTMSDLAHDYNSHWMTACQFLSDDTYIGAENSHNLFTCQRHADAPNEEERQRLEIVGEYHLGSFVNRFQSGSVAKLGAPECNCTLYGSSDGSLGIIAQLSNTDFEFAKRAELAINNVINGVGGLKHTEWRSFNNERRVAAPRQFVDGDIIELFLDLPMIHMEEVAARMEMSVQEITKRIEDLSRLH